MLWLIIRTQGRNNKKFVPYTIMLKATDYYDDGRVVDIYKELRFVDSRGNWRSLLTYTNGQTIETVGKKVKGLLPLIPENAAGSSGISARVMSRTCKTSKRVNAYETHTSPFILSFGIARLAMRRSL